MSVIELKKIEEEIPACKACPRLINYIHEVAEKKVRRFRDWDYWGKPVPGFGDPNAQLYILGLAPAAHGANRTGRMFTGDSSGDWLYKALYETGFASQPTSVTKDDGLKLINAYIGSIARCAPPQNKPTREEVSTCTSLHLENEFRVMKNIKIILCLGRLAFDQYKRMYGLKGLEFDHNGHYDLPSGKLLWASYHPSRQNTQTGFLKWESWVEVFADIHDKLKNNRH